MNVLHTFASAVAVGGALFAMAAGLVGAQVLAKALVFVTLGAALVVLVTMPDAGLDDHDGDAE